MNEAANALINDVKAKICAEIIRKPDFSLRQIAELAFLLGLDAGVDISQPTTRPSQEK